MLGALHNLEQQQNKAAAVLHLWVLALIRYSAYSRLRGQRGESHTPTNYFLKHPR